MKVEKEGMSTDIVADYLTALSNGRLSTSEVQDRFDWNLEQQRALAEQLGEEGLILRESEDGWEITNSNGMGEFTLAWRCGVPLLYLPHCTSTNDVAAQFALSDSNLRLVASNYQTAGKGRMGRTWSAAEDENLLFSVIFRPKVSPEKVARCALLWGAVIADELGLKMKWPNDLQNSSGEKVGGILSQIEVSGGQLSHVIFGVGLNVNQLEFPDLPLASSMRLNAKSSDVIDRAALLARVLNRLLACDLDQNLDIWRKNASTLGQRVRIGDVEGLAEGVREDGALIVDGNPVLAGDVHMVSGL